MAWKAIVGARFSPAEFDDYVRQQVFSVWRPQFVVVHNTGTPLTQRPVGLTPAHIQNLVTYYRDDQGWSAGPHCFVDQNGIWVFTPLTTTGVHSPSWNDISWGVEALGDYETDVFTDPIHEHLVACLATLHAAIPLDVSQFRFHREDPLTTHACPGVHMVKSALMHDVRELLAARQTLANPASGRFTGSTPADVAAQSHFFTDQGAVTQSDANAYGPVISDTPADKEDKFRVTAGFNASADVNAYAVGAGMVMLQRVNDPANPGSYLPKVVNLVLKPYKQPMRGFTPVKYFVYRNLRLDEFLKGTSATDEALVRSKAGASAFIQNAWAVHTAQNGTAPFESRVLGFDPSKQSSTAVIDQLFHRQNLSEQLPFVAMGEQIGKFYTNAGADSFGLEIVLEGDVQLDYDYVRKSTEAFIDVSGKPTGTAEEKFTVSVERARVLSYVDPAAFFGMHMASGGWLQVKTSTGKKKLVGAAVYDDVMSPTFATKNTLYIDVRNENGLPLNFHGAYDDGAGNAIEVGDAASALVAQPYATDRWPLIIRRAAAAANPKDYSSVFCRLLRGYNNKPILYLEHGEPDGTTTKGRFIADADLIAPAAAKTNVIGFRYPNKDLGGGQRIGVAWMLKIEYALRQDPANVPFPPNVLPTASYLDNLFGPIDAEPPWVVSKPAIAWATTPNRKYVDGAGVATLGFEHMARRGVAFSAWGAGSNTEGNVLFYAADEDTFTNSTKTFVPQNGLASGVSNRASFFEEPMLFDGYSVTADAITDGPVDVRTMALKETQPFSRPPEAMLLVGLTRAELETNLKPLAGFDSRFPRNLVLQELPGSPFTDSKGNPYRKYKIGLSGAASDGKPRQVFPAVDVIGYTADRNFFFTNAFAKAQPLPKLPKRNAEETFGEEIRPGDTYPIAAAAGATVTVSQKNIHSSGGSPDPDVDFTREIVEGDKVTIRNVGYDVLSVSKSGRNGVITLNQTPAATPGTDTLRVPNKAYEDYYIAKDRLAPLTGRMELLVKQFITSIDAVPDDPTAPAAVEALVNDFGPKILQRARLLCNDGAFSYADDRVLYWARIKMMVRMKNHPYLVRVETERERLVRVFETKSRGYDAISFSGAGTRKRVLVSGFDPFQIGLNRVRSNPSGAAALALHGKDFSQGSTAIHVQSVIFPVRYADFDRNAAPTKGTGVVEDFFEPFIKIAGNRPHLIVTLSQGGTFEFWVDRFASRKRGGYPDNLLIPNSQFPTSVAGDQFYETTLPPLKIVPAGNTAGIFKVFYNNIFIYEWTNTAGVTESAKYVANPQADNTRLEIEDTAHPDHGALQGLVPTQLTDLTTPKKADVKAVLGSGGHYLSNEIFYRVSRLRTMHASTMVTGHYHVPLIQHHSGDVPQPSRADNTFSTSSAFRPEVLKKLIEEIRDSLLRAFS